MRRIRTRTWSLILRLSFHEENHLNYVHVVVGKASRQMGEMVHHLSIQVLHPLSASKIKPIICGRRPLGTRLYSHGELRRLHSSIRPFGVHI
jgi:hypothetical protein